ncbi:Putative DNA-binding domain-containing protein [Corynebacterium appendicis CIP 107643]|uniref:Putative DNA-binding domain-containing protein n=1 Tax=Corynebacterium appendicis CIP 107643 TaxID=1161099 RepID=A0A1N7IV73_9CORY|nr:ATP-binding protein [Corynebacterium appendicis]WJY61008.1 Divergent AAA domain protein [Corynebacterium appendicis CIP 107643]SIS40926.1 Putative DNA-binding domain-containing protein [Corynebacterium appendicis CIP 107643]
MFTSLHRALGLPAGPITDDMITQAVENDVPESEDLDFKQALPPKESLVQSDVKKDLAAMANYGGGVIIYGVTDSDSRAGARLDTGPVDDNYIQAYQRVAYNHVTPPLHNVEMFPLVSDDGTHALAVIVPASQQVPHMLIGKDKKFNVPIRHGADTDWLAESEIARLYQQRFSAARQRRELTLELYERTRELAAPLGFWAVGVARPVTRTLTAPMAGQDVSQLADRLVNQRENLWHYNRPETPYGAYYANVHPRRGFRSWRYLFISREGGHPESYLAFHDDGSVSALVNLPVQEEGNSVHTFFIEAFTADLMLAARGMSTKHGSPDYDLRVGVEWQGSEPLRLYRPHEIGAFDPLPITKFVPVEATVDFSDDGAFFDNAEAIAEDCLNQAGIRDSKIIPRGRDAGISCT